MKKKTCWIRLPISLESSPLGLSNVWQGSHLPPDTVGELPKQASPLSQSQLLSPPSGLLVDSLQQGRANIPAAWKILTGRTTTHPSSLPHSWHSAWHTTGLSKGFLNYIEQSGKHRIPSVCSWHTGGVWWLSGALMKVTSSLFVSLEESSLASNPLVTKPTLLSGWRPKENQNKIYKAGTEWIYKVKQIRAGKWRCWSRFQNFHYSLPLPTAGQQKVVTWKLNCAQGFGLSASINVWCQWTML